VYLRSDFDALPICPEAARAEDRRYLCSLRQKAKQIIDPWCAPNARFALTHHRPNATIFMKKRRLLNVRKAERVRDCGGAQGF
jgi:hypothetical protein